MSVTNSITAARIFNGHTWLTNHVIVTKDGRIHDIRLKGEDPEDNNNVEGGMIVPAFIDLQMYGAGGKLLSAFPEISTLDIISRHNRQSGTVLCLPTVATNSKEVVYRCIDTVKDYWKSNGQGILGLHLEGPWINILKKGAHLEEFIHPPSLQETGELLEYGKGVIKMITLAPELCDAEILELIASNGIRISAGHSNASFEEANNAFNLGVPAATHLFNAMSPLHHRDTGLPGAVFENLNVRASIIPDGIHVDFSAVRIAKSIMKDRLFAITDAVTETTIGPYQHQKNGDKYEAGGILSGSALTMNIALKNLVHRCGIETGEAIRMCSLYPAELMGLNDFGRIAKGSSARLLVLNDNLDLINNL